MTVPKIVPKILIGIPHGGLIPIDGLIGFERLHLPPDTAVLRIYSRPVHIARNEIVATALAQCPDATHLFFLDDDTVLPPDGLLRLLDAAQAYDTPLLTALCTQRTPPYLPCVYHQAPNNGQYVHLSRMATEGLQEIDACGAACLLIRMDVLRTMAKQVRSNGRPIWFEWTADGFGEDIAFCRVARRLGYRIALDPSVQATHLGVLEATYDRFLREGLPDLTYASVEIARLANEVRKW